MSKSILFFALISFCSSLAAQENEEQTKNDWKIVPRFTGYEDFLTRGSLSVGGLAIDDKVANSVGISSEGYSFIGEYGFLFKKQWIVSLGLSAEIFKDKRKFRENISVTETLGGLTINEYNDSATSDINSWSVFLEAGYFWKPFKSDKLITEINYGVRRFDMKRTIPGCSNCSEAPIDLGLPTYIRPKLSYLISENRAIGVSLSHFLGSSDYDSEITIGYQFLND